MRSEECPSTLVTLGTPASSAIFLHHPRTAPCKCNIYSNPPICLVKFSPSILSFTEIGQYKMFPSSNRLSILVAQSSATVPVAKSRLSDWNLAPYIILLFGRVNSKKILQRPTCTRVQPPVFRRARTESNLRQFVGGKSRISYHHIIRETYANAMRIPAILGSISADTKIGLIHNLIDHVLLAKFWPEGLEVVRLDGLEHSVLKYWYLCGQNVWFCKTEEDRFLVIRIVCQTLTWIVMRFEHEDEK